MFSPWVSVWRMIIIIITFIFSFSFALVQHGRLNEMLVRRGDMDCCFNCWQQSSEKWSCGVAKENWQKIEEKQNKTSIQNSSNYERQLLKNDCRVWELAASPDTSWTLARSLLLLAQYWKPPIWDNSQLIEINQPTQTIFTYKNIFMHINASFNYPDTEISLLHTYSEPLKQYF